MQENFEKEYETLENQVSYVYKNGEYTTPARSFSTLECIFAWLSLLFGYIFCRLFPAHLNPLFGFIFIILLFAATLTVLKIKKAKITAFHTAAAISAVVVASALLIGSNAFINFFAFSYALAVYCYLIYSINGNSVNGVFSDYILADFIKALFVLPFLSITKIFKALFLSKKSGKHFLKILVGFLAAVIPTAIIFSLLSYDSYFLRLWNMLFTFNASLIFSYIASIIFSIPIGMYIFGLFISASDKKGAEILSESVCKATGEKLKKVPFLTAISATVPIIITYILFFASQIEYYVAGFLGKLPEELSYAQYAREGFFQLCAVAVINLIIIIAISLTLRQDSKAPAVALKILTVIFAICTLFLISTAVAKMLMYIDFYGLTQKRVYAFWFMIVLTIIFILVTVKQFIPSVRAVALSLAVTIILFAALSVSGVDGIIAKSNVDRYINGNLKKVDTVTLTELGDAAIPELVRLYDHVKEKSKNGQITQEDFNVLSGLKYTLTDTKKEFEQNDFDLSQFTVSGYRAKKALKNWEK